MKVILLQNVPKLGQKGDIKNVSEGFARNCLIPQKKVKSVADGEEKDDQNKSEYKAQKEEVLNDKVSNIFKQLATKKVLIKEKANEKGHLFAQVHLKEIADAVGSIGLDISEDWIHLEKPIKEIGEFVIPLEAFGQKGKVKIKIEAE